MEVASSLAGAMRVGVQVAASYKGPHLEVYVDVMNIIGPEVEYRSPYKLPDQPPEVIKTRDRDVYIQFQLINIGGERAENIRVTRTGEFKRWRDDAEAFSHTRVIAQMAPGQVMQLFLLDQHELDEPGEDGRSRGFQPGDLVLDVEYDSPGGVVNFLKTLLPRVLRRTSHHRLRYIFNATAIEGDLPPARYS